MTKLLEHEKAERERDKDNKRKSESAGQYERKMPPSLEEYIKKREAEIELYKEVSPSLKPYYKFLVEEYFKELKGFFQKIYNPECNFYYTMRHIKLWNRKTTVKLKY